MLGVLETTRPVVERARSVRIDQPAVEQLADRLADRRAVAPAWRVWPHWWDGTDASATYVLVLDALNFSFWGEPRWRVGYGGKRLDGYWALAACLRRAIEAGVPILEPAYLVALDAPEARALFAGDHDIPMLEARIANLREVGRGLEALGGSFATLVRSANRSGEALVGELIRRFPSFDDVTTYDGAEVRLFKRAQILVSDLYGIYEGRGLGAFDDLARLTAFADYKVPQVLREAGILVYDGALADTIERLEEIPSGDPREVEIRAATVWGCERLRLALAERSPGTALSAFEIDWLLWSDAQGREIARPYHRTRTIFY